MKDFVGIFALLAISLSGLTAHANEPKNNDVANLYNLKTGQSKMFLGYSSSGSICKIEIMRSSDIGAHIFLSAEFGKDEKYTKLLVDNGPDRGPKVVFDYSSVMVKPSPLTFSSTCSNLVEYLSEDIYGKDHF